MLYALWSVPAILVAGSIASGRANAFWAAVIGTGTALIVAGLAAPRTFAPHDAAVALLRGAWIGWTVVPYILGGLLFWRIATHPAASDAPSAGSIANDRSRRRLLFAACFLVGPFAEAATGFGVGIIGTMVMIRPLGVKPIFLLAFSLLSQTMIPWGAMGSGSLIAAAFAGTDATSLLLHSSVFIVAFHAAWLPLFWGLAEKAGLGAGWQERRDEASWVVAGLGALVVSTALLGPETSLLAAYGPLVVVRHIVDARPGRSDLERALRRILPFIFLIGWLVAIRLISPLHDWLESICRFAPFDGAPSWSPFQHAGTWLIAGAVLTWLLRPSDRTLVQEICVAWSTGRLAILTIALFAMMAEVLSGSGIAEAMAKGLFASMGRNSVLLTPLIAGSFGILTNSGNASNGLFMASQVKLATEAGLNVAAVVALQNVSGASMSMFSPVRMAIVCNLAGMPGGERDAFRVMIPFAASAVAILLLGAVAIVAN